MNKLEYYQQQAEGVISLKEQLEYARDRMRDTDGCPQEGWTDDIGPLRDALDAVIDVVAVLVDSANAGRTEAPATAEESATMKGG